MMSRVRVSFDSVRPEDRDAVLQLLSQAPEVAPYLSPELFDEWLREGDFVKAVDPAGALVGVVHARDLEDALWLEGIAVSPDIRRKGVGRQLATYVISKHGAKVVRVMASERNVPSNQLALSLGFKPVDYVYFCDGRRAAAAEIAASEGLKEVDVPPGVPGYVDRWVWRPMAFYRGRAYGREGVVLLDTDPPFFAVGDIEGYRRFTRVRGACPEGYIVYELRLG